MKPLPQNFIKFSRTAIRAFTLTEMVVAITVFTLVVLATVAVQIYASRVYTLAGTTLNTAQQARMTMNDIRDTVREARIVYVGNYQAAAGNPLNNFSVVANGGLQQGNALEIFPSPNNTNNFTLVYLQPGNGTSFTVFSPSGAILNTNSLIRITYTNGMLAASNDIADYVTNQIVFDAEDFEGNVLTANENNYLIHMTLDFSQWEYPIAMVGTNSFNAFDYYQLNTVMTRRDTD
jgi:type II secretory pathway pseudopilin PulG